MPKKTEYEKKLAYNNQYNRETYRSFSIRLNRSTEADLIQWLEDQGEVKSYLVRLIRKDMEKAQKKKDKEKKKDKK